MVWGWIVQVGLVGWRMVWLGLVAKPVCYVVAYTIAHVQFKGYGPHSKLPAWLAVVLAALLRVVLGVAGVFLMQRLPREVFVWGGSLVIGCFCWFLAAKAFFSRTPTEHLVAFAVACEVVVAVLDYVLSEV